MLRYCTHHTLQIEGCIFVLFPKYSSFVYNQPVAVWNCVFGIRPRGIYPVLRLHFQRMNHAHLCPCRNYLFATTRRANQNFNAIKSDEFVKALYIHTHMYMYIYTIYTHVYVSYISIYTQIYKHICTNTQSKFSALEKYQLFT